MVHSQDAAFVIDGFTLELALKYEREAFTELALLAKTALCCRVTPSQKAEVCFSNFLISIFLQLSFLFLKINVFAYLITYIAPSLVVNFIYADVFSES